MESLTGVMIIPWMEDNTVEADGGLKFSFDSSTVTKSNRGIVVGVGDHVKKVAVGDRVLFKPNYVTAFVVGDVPYIHAEEQFIVSKATKPNEFFDESKMPTFD